MAPLLLSVTNRLKHIFVQSRICDEEEESGGLSPGDASSLLVSQLKAEIDDAALVDPAAKLSGVKAPRKPHLRGRDRKKWTRRGATPR
jgi:hypothetical protein